MTMKSTYQILLLFKQSTLITNMSKKNSYSANWNNKRLRSNLFSHHLHLPGRVGPTNLKKLSARRAKKKVSQM